MAKRMTQQQFRVATSMTGVNSLPVLQACEAVLVRGESQYAVSRSMGVDQGQVSKAVKSIRSVGWEALQAAIQSLDQVSMLAAAGLVDFPPGAFELSDRMLRSLKAIAEQGDGDAR